MEKRVKIMLINSFIFIILYGTFWVYEIIVKHRITNNINSIMFDKAYNIINNIYTDNICIKDNKFNKYNFLKDIVFRKNNITFSCNGIDNINIFNLTKLDDEDKKINFKSINEIEYSNISTEKIFKNLLYDNYIREYFKFSYVYYHNIFVSFDKNILKNNKKFIYNEINNLYKIFNNNVSNILKNRKHIIKIKIIQDIKLDTDSQSKEFLYKNDQYKLNIKEGKILNYFLNFKIKDNNISSNINKYSNLVISQYNKNSDLKKLLPRLIKLNLNIFELKNHLKRNFPKAKINWNKFFSSNNLNKLYTIYFRNEIKYYLSSLNYVNNNKDLAYIKEFINPINNSIWEIIKIFSKKTLTYENFQKLDEIIEFSNIDYYKTIYMYEMYSMGMFLLSLGLLFIPYLSVTEIIKSILFNKKSGKKSILDRIKAKVLEFLME